MKTYSKRLRATLGLILLTVVMQLGISFVYSPVQPAVDGAMAAQQLNGGTDTYVATNAILRLPNLMWKVTGVILVALWLPPLVSYTLGRRKAPTVAAFALCTIMLMTGCGPARIDVFQEVGPNETAFVIPLVGDTAGNQAKFNSVDYLNQKKIAAKRVPIPQVQKVTGRMWWDYEWIPAVAVFKVDRSLVSREWTSRDGSGTAAHKDEGIPVVTSDGIQLTLGAAVTVYIEEEDASSYLYYHGLQKLEHVTDNNIRNFCISELTREYGNMSLQDAKTNGPVIFAKLFKDAKEYFKTKGITVSQLGNAEGYEFKNPDIQKSINARFTAEQDIQTAAQEKLAQDKRNEKILATASTSATAAKTIFEASEATKLQNELEIKMIQAKAALAMAEKWNGALPANILPANSPLLMSLGTTSGTNSPR